MWVVVLSSALKFSSLMLNNLQGKIFREVLKIEICWFQKRKGKNLRWNEGKEDFSDL